MTMKHTIRRMIVVSAACLLLTQLLIFSAEAATITISSTTIAAGTTYPISPSATATLRIYSSITFTASDGTVVMMGTSGSGNFFKSVTCTISNGVITIPSFTLLSTTDAIDNANARYTAIFFDSKGVKRDTYLADFPLPITIGNPTTWAQIRVYKAGNQPLRDTSTYTKQQTDAQIAAAVVGANAPKATDVIPGILKTSVVPTDSANPIAVGDNDPRVNAEYFAQTFSTFTNALSECAAANATLVIDTTVTKLNTATIPATCHLRFTNTGRISSSFSYTITGSVDAPARQIFSGAGTVSFSGQGIVAHPEWWTANTTPGTTNMTVAIQAALTAVGAGPYGGFVSLGAQDYATTATLLIPQYVGLRGQGIQSSRLVYSGPDVGVKFNGTAGSYLRGQSLRDLEILLTNNSGQGIYVLGAHSYVIENVYVEGVPHQSNRGITVEASIYGNGRFINLNHVKYGYWIKGTAATLSQTTTFNCLNCNVGEFPVQSGSIGWQIDSDSGESDVTGANIEYMDKGIYANDCHGMRFRGTRFEGIGTHAIHLTSLATGNNFPDSQGLDEAKILNESGVGFNANNFWSSHQTDYSPLPNLIVGPSRFVSFAAANTPVRITAGTPTQSADLLFIEDSSGTAKYFSIGPMGAFSSTAPVTKTNDFTWSASENWIVANKGSSLVTTLPAAASFTGRQLHIQTIQNQTVVSVSSNVVPLAGGAAGTAILSGTAGKWATLISNGTSWVIVQGN